MSFSYSADPATSDSDAVRFLVGDTDPTEFFLSDEEITWLLTQWSSKGTVFYSASMAAEAIAAKCAREVTTSSDSQTVATSELQNKFLDLAARLMQQHRLLLSDGNVDVGGINVGEQPDPTVINPAFGIRMHDFNEAGMQDLGDVNSTGWYIDTYGEQP